MAKKKKNFQDPMADMSEKALYFSKQCCTAKELQRMVPGNFHTSLHTAVMKKGNLAIVTFTYFIYFFLLFLPKSSVCLSASSSSISSGAK